MSALSVARQFRYTNKAFWRNPASAFFTFVFPLMFLVIFTALLGNGTSRSARRPDDQARRRTTSPRWRRSRDHRLLHEHRDLGHVPAREGGILKRSARHAVAGVRRT